MSLDLAPAPSSFADTTVIAVADTTRYEIPIFACGTFAPGQVHDPCQHSVLNVRCCTCAGCMFDVWSCRREPGHDSWARWEAEKLGALFAPWVRHRYALVLYALVVIFLLTSHTIESLLWIVRVVDLGLLVALGYVVHETLTRR